MAWIDPSGLPPPPKKKYIKIRHCVWVLRHATAKSGRGWRTIIIIIIVIVGVEKWFKKKSKQRCRHAGRTESTFLRGHDLRPGKSYRPASMTISTNRSSRRPSCPCGCVGSSSVYSVLQVNRYPIKPLFLHRPSGGRWSGHSTRNVSCFRRYNTKHTRMVRHHLHGTGRCALEHETFS